MAYTVLLPGMFTPGKRAAELAYHFHHADAVVTDRYLGLGSLEQAYERALEQIAVLHARYGKLRLISHSLGARLSVEIALKHPELVESVEGISGPFDGIGSVPAPLLGLAAVVPGIRELLCDRDQIADFQNQVATGWDSKVSLNLVALAWDFVVHPRRSALALNPPPGSNTGKYWVGPLCPRRLPDGTKFVRDFFGIDHLTAVLNGRLSSLN